MMSRTRRFPAFFRQALLGMALVVAAGPVAAQPPAPARPAPAQPAPPAQAAPAPPAPAPLQKQPAAADVQILLDRAGFSPGVIDGKGGSNTLKALKAYQTSRKLPVGDSVDAATWQALTAGGAVTFAEYRITPEDIRGPYLRSIPEDMVEKSKLSSLGYTSLLEMLGERFHATPEFLRKLNPRARFAAGETIRVPAVRQVPEEKVKAPEGITVVVSKQMSTLVVWQSDPQNPQGGQRAIFFAPVTAGSEHDPLPIGTWEVKGVARNPDFNYNPDLFWDAEPGHSKAKIQPGPNNPVGRVWVDLDKEHYGIHGTPEPRTIGRSFSHGCVRLTNWDVLTLASLVEPGTPVLFQE